jgi:hypothetical protein
MLGFLKYICHYINKFIFRTVLDNFVGLALAGFDEASAKTVLPTPGNPLRIITFWKLRSQFLKPIRVI